MCTSVDDLFSCFGCCFLFCFFFFVVVVVLQFYFEFSIALYPVVLLS